MSEKIVFWYRNDNFVKLINNFDFVFFLKCKIYFALFSWILLYLFDCIDLSNTREMFKNCTQGSMSSAPVNKPLKLSIQF